jgi:hypothetical protein
VLDSPACPRPIKCARPSTDAAQRGGDLSRPICWTAWIAPASLKMRRWKTLILTLTFSHSLSRSSLPVTTERRWRCPPIPRATAATPFPFPPSLSRSSLPAMTPNRWMSVWLLDDLWSDRCSRSGLTSRCVEVAHRRVATGLTGAMLSV